MKRLAALVAVAFFLPVSLSPQGESAATGFQLTHSSPVRADIDGADAVLSDDDLRAATGAGAGRNTFDFICGLVFGGTAAWIILGLAIPFWGAVTIVAIETACYFF